MTKLQPKEYGSEYHWISFYAKEVTNCIRPGTLLFSTGRSALVSLLRNGVKEYKWKRIWMPQYFCPEVVLALHTTGMDIGYYFDSPIDTPKLPNRLETGDVIFITNHFGLKTNGCYSEFYDLGVPIIEDHTHDPWSSWANTSNADYAVASYRKVLPIPDGAGLWSPRGRDIAMCEVGEVAQISDKLQAMLLKSAYLTCGWPAKEDYLALYHKYAELLGSSCFNISILSMNMLRSFPWDHWRHKRKRNFLAMEKNIVDIDNVRLVKAHDASCCPYSFIIIFDTNDRREKVRQSLIHNDIYPAILWSFPKSIQSQFDGSIVDLSERMLSFYIDGRYTEDDMTYISSSIRKLL